MIVIEMRKQKFILFSFKLTSVNRRLFTISLPIARFSFMFSLFFAPTQKMSNCRKNFHSKLTCTLADYKKEKRKLASSNEIEICCPSNKNEKKNFKLWCRHFSTPLVCAYFNDFRKQRRHSFNFFVCPRGGGRDCVNFAS